MGTRVASPPYTLHVPSPLCQPPRGCTLSLSQGWWRHPSLAVGTAGGSWGAPRGAGDTHRVKGFLKDEEGSREADDEEGLGAEEAEEHALHTGGDEQLRHPHHPVGLLTWRGAEPVGARLGGQRCAPIPHPSAPGLGAIDPQEHPHGMVEKAERPPAPRPAGGTSPSPGVSPACPSHYPASLRR